MTTYSVNSIVCKIKNAFPCEAISEPICEEVCKALSCGIMPKFEDVECSCTFNKRAKTCIITGKSIETRMRVLGITEMCKDMIRSDPNEEGEWN